LKSSSEPSENEGGEGNVQKIGKKELGPAKNNYTRISFWKDML